MINHSDRYPAATGNPANCEAEISGVRGFPDSRQIDATSREWADLATASAEKLEIARQHREAAQAIADNPKHSDGIRAEALELAQGYEKTVLHFQSEAQRLSEGAEGFKRRSEAAQRFESRWTGFDVYNPDPARVEATE